MTPAARRSRYQRSTGCSLTKPWPPSSCTPFGADLHPLLGAQRAGERGLAARTPGRGRRGSRRAGREPHALQLDADVGDAERDRLAVGDRLAERDALVDVGDHVVEHGLRGADRERAPGEPRALHALGVDVAVAVAEQRRAPAGGRPRAARGRSRRRAGPSPARPRRRRPAAPGSTGTAPGRGPRAARRRRAARARSARGDERLDAVEHAVLAVAPRGRLQLQRVEQRPRLVQRQRGGGHVLADEAPAGRSPAGRRRPTGRARWRRAPGASAATARPMSPCASASARARRWSPRRSCITPPSSSGTPSIVRPSSLAWASSSAGVAALGVGRQGGGPQLPSAKSRTASWSICCSSSGAEVEEAAGLAGRLARRPGQLSARP